VRAGLLLALIACSNDTARDDKLQAPDQQPRQTPGPQPKVTLTTPQGEVTVNVEVVSAPAQVQKGLMFREHLAPDAGMLFIMGHETDHAFYMRNTLIPLDMIFITKDGTVAGIVQNAEPRTETLRRVGKTSLYVLEVNGGWTAAHHVAAGARVRFDGVTPL
jgi:uncharacterized membrane protein (UPF0127 family)